MYEELVKTLISCPDAEYGCSRCKYKNSLGCREKLMSEAGDAIEKLQEDFVPLDDMEMILEEVAKPRWIPVTERLPLIFQPVLVCSEESGIEVDRLNFQREWLIYGDVTHWLPLPEPPEEET